MHYRCEQMGVKTVPVMWKGTIPDDYCVFTKYLDEYDTMQADFKCYYDAGNFVKAMAEQFYDGPDPIGKTHVREGVVVRILNRPKFCAYKHKNWSFKALEGIVKVEAEAPDIEEAESIEGE